MIDVVWGFCFLTDRQTDMALVIVELLLLLKMYAQTLDSLRGIIKALSNEFRFNISKIYNPYKK